MTWNKHSTVHTHTTTGTHMNRSWLAEVHFSLEFLRPSARSRNIFFGWVASVCVLFFWFCTQKCIEIKAQIQIMRLTVVLLCYLQSCGFTLQTLLSSWCIFLRPRNIIRDKKKTIQHNSRYAKQQHSNAWFWFRWFCTNGLNFNWNPIIWTIPKQATYKQTKKNLSRPFNKKKAKWRANEWKWRIDCSFCITFFCCF